ncbi:MAG: InlB B-repeat-containing protein [Mobilitalea sp.]
MIKNGTQIEGLSLPVVDMTESGDEAANGSFTYTGSNNLKIGDVLCIYSGDKPEAPNGDNGDAEYLDDSIAYVKVTAITGSTGNQKISYSNADSEEVLFMPDVLPVAVGDGSKLTNYTAATENVSGSLTAVKSDLNFATYADMGLTEETTIDVGDYIAFFTGTFNDSSSAGSVVYGEVTSVTENDGSETVSFVATTAEKMQEVLDYYSKNDVDGDALLSDIDVAVVEEEIEQQVLESDFAEEASVYLTAIALETDGFQEIAGDDYELESLSIKMADGTDADLNVIKSMATDSKVAIKNLKINAEIGKTLKKLSGKGVRCAVTVSFDVEVKAAGDNNAVIIYLSATFVEELKVSVDASGKAVWKKKWIFPYIADYQMSANIDLYNYTGISFQAKVATKGDTNTIDISAQMQKILSYTDPGQISTDVQELFDIYGDMMENETDWIDIFTQNISTNDQHLLLGIINIKTTVDFVVSANINVALGCNFEYRSGTRYCFWAKVKAKDAGSNTIDLMDEVYSFQFYVMGSLGLRAGIRLEFAVGLFSVDLNSIGLTAEAGVYAKLYGYFFYQLDSVNNLKTSKMSGALYLDFGIYMKIAFKAQVLKGTFQYNPTLVEKEWPLLSVGAQYNVYNFAYDKSTAIIKMKDTVRAYTLPDSTYNMTYLDLKEGDISTKTYKVNDFNTTFSNSNFSLVENTVKVNVPKGTHKLECDMTVSWKSSSLAFSSVPMSRTFHLVWDDLNDNGYTITYDSKGGNAVSSVTKLYGATVTEPTAPQKTGYTFGGWYNNVNLTTKYTFGTMPAENIVLYAMWTPNTNTMYKVEHYQQNVGNDNYTLYEKEIKAGTTGTNAMATAKTYDGFNFNSNTIGTVSSSIIAPDGSLVLKQYYGRNRYTVNYSPENGGSEIAMTVKYGAVISPPTVVKTGYTFKSWDYTIARTMPAGNITYTAQWTPKIYTIDFNTNGGSTVDQIKQAYGTTVNVPSIPNKLGYTFGGWYSDVALSNVYTFSTMSAVSITLNAKWNLSTNTAYKVEHYQQNLVDNSYTLYATETLNGTTGTTASATAKSYGGFNYNSSAIGTTSSGIIAPDGSLVLKQYYSRNSYTLTFKPENGGIDIVASVKYGAEVTAPTIVKTGYNFIGWSDTVAQTMPTADTTYTAQWNSNTNTSYKVEYYQQNLVDDNYTLYATETLIGTTGTTVSAAAKSYEGFNYISSAIGTISSGIIAPDGSLVLKQYYGRNSYTLTFKLVNSEADLVVNQVKYGTVITAPTVLKPGYTFEGWDSTVATTMPAANTTYTAQWTPNNYTIDFNTNDGSTVDQITQAYGADVNEPATPTKLGYIFGGWYSDVALSNVYTFSTMPAASITLNAKWDLNTNMAYKVEHYEQNIMEDGYTLKEIENCTGTFNTIVEATTKIYVGFTYNSNTNGTVSSGTLAEDGSLTLKQYYDRNSYTLTFEPDNGEEEVVNQIKYGTVIAAPTVLKPGYTFAGWNSTVAATMPALNTIYTAQWTIENHTIEFDTDGGSPVDQITQPYGTDVTAPAIPTKLGYTFGDWYSDVALSDVYTFSTMPAASITLYAKWSPNDYTITFDSDEGSPVSLIMQAYGTIVNAPVKPTKTDKYFAGWYRDEALSVAYTFSLMPAEDITLFARWTDQDESARLEGENGVLYGFWTRIETNPSASGGAHAGYIDEVGAGVSFVNLNASNSIILCYAGMSGGTFSIYVNGVKKGFITLLGTGGYMIYAITKIDGLNLTAGDTLSFQYDSGNTAFNIDYIAYSTSDTVPTITVQN